jgi:bacterioferritin-associated ferredoxin
VTTTHVSPAVIEKMAQDLEELRAHVGSCSQCGQSFAAEACGPTHALVANVQHKASEVLTESWQLRADLDDALQKIRALQPQLRENQAAIRQARADHPEMFPLFDPPLPEQPPTSP